MDDNQKAREGFKNLSFAEKLEHIWFYYKWFILVGIIVFAFLIVCIVQFASKKDYDAGIMYAGPQTIHSDYIGSVCTAICDVMTEDYNQDGEKAVSLTQIQLYGESDEPKYSEAQANENVAKALQFQQNAKNQFYNERINGTSVIYLMDEEIFNGMVKDYEETGNCWIIPLEEVLGYIPENAIGGGFGIRLSELDCYKYTDMRYLPSNAVLCIRPQRKMKDALYEQNVKTFIDMVEWKNNGGNK